MYTDALIIGTCNTRQKNAQGTGHSKHVVYNTHATSACPCANFCSECILERVGDATRDGTQLRLGPQREKYRHYELASKLVEREHVPQSQIADPITLSFTVRRTAKLSLPVGLGPQTENPRIWVLLTPSFDFLLNQHSAQEKAEPPDCVDVTLHAALSGQTNESSRNTISRMNTHTSLHHTAGGRRRVFPAPRRKNRKKPPKFSHAKTFERRAKETTIPNK